MRWLVNFSDLIEARIHLSLFVRLLRFCLSERYLVLWHVVWVLRFCDMKTLICRGRFLLWIVGGKWVEHDQAVSCINLIRRFTASSILSGNFKLTIRLIWFSRVDLNCFQSIWPWLGYFGLLRVVVLIVNKTEKWSEQRSFRLVVIVCRLFGIS